MAKMIYRKIAPKIWNSLTFRRLSAPNPCGRYLVFYLLTNPDTTNIPGLFRSGRLQMAEALGWPVKAFDATFSEASREGFAEASWNDRVVYLPKAIYYNEPESPNVVRGWAKYADMIPDCELKTKALNELKSYCYQRGKAFGKAFGEAFGEACAHPSAKDTPHPLLNQEQEQEQEQDFKSSMSLLANQIFDYHRKKCKDKNQEGQKPRLTIPKLLNTKTSKAIQARIKEGYTAANLQAAVAGCLQTPHNLGKNDRGEPYTSLELICRDGANVERFAGNAYKILKSPGRTVNDLRGYIPAPDEETTDYTDLGFMQDTMDRYNAEEGAEMDTGDDNVGYPLGGSG